MASSVSIWLRTTIWGWSRTTTSSRRLSRVCASTASGRAVRGDFTAPWMCIWIWRSGWLSLWKWKRRWFTRMRSPPLPAPFRRTRSEGTSSLCEYQLKLSNIFQGRLQRQGW
uniref:(northern house mosquito) hypothetical protein n=1 Tax=Culex pipiens TaxID=7175 RepID=A0A8D8FYI5_CULPI